MPGKLDAYNLGQHGVNRAKSPIHLKDGELLTAQNVALNPIGGAGSISKRRGMTKLTTGGALAGTIMSMATIPFVDPGP